MSLLFVFDLVSCGGGGCVPTDYTDFTDYTDSCDMLMVCTFGVGDQTDYTDYTDYTDSGAVWCVSGVWWGWGLTDYTD